MEEKRFDEKLKNTIVSRIVNNFDVKEIILFGSYAFGNPNEDSDIDLIVILNETGFSQRYWDIVEKRVTLAKLLLDIKREIPIDLLVYTQDEWKKLTSIGSSFNKEVNTKGIKLYENYH